MRQTDRGFSVAYVVDEVMVPERVDPRTGAVTCRPEKTHHFRCAPRQAAHSLPAWGRAQRRLGTETLVQGLGPGAAQAEIWNPCPGPGAVSSPG